MNEITKLYENAGIKPIKQGYCDWDSDCPYPDIINNGCGDECPYWKYEDEAEYPLFTAEKQIELICFLLNADIKIDICKEPNMKMEICDIAEALAEVTNTIWQDLTEAEKQQVKGILE